MINIRYVDNFSRAIDIVEDRGALKNVLLQSRSARVLSEAETHFWNFAQKAIHRDFDMAYAKGIDKLATLDKKISLQPNLTSTFVKEATTGITMGAGGLAGWLVGYVYNDSTSNLILHEHGHALADQLIYTNAKPVTTTISEYWFHQRNWTNWLHATREGAPANVTHISTGDGPSAFGATLTAAEKSLLLSGAGVGSEALLNIFIATLGLISIRQKHRVLGASLLGFALIAHSHAHSYIRRYEGILTNGWDPSVGTGGGDDPLNISYHLAQILNCDPATAYQILYYGYALVPIAIVGLLALLILKSTDTIPDEAVLTHLLTTEDPAVKRALAEVEIEMDHEIQTIPQERLVYQMSERLLEKLKSEPVFEKTRKEITEVYKSKFEHPLGWSDRLKIVASITATVAYLCLSFKLKALFTPLAYTFVAAQAVCTVFDIIQTIHDLKNQALSTLAKALSVSRTTISVATLITVSILLFTPGANTALITFLLVASILRLLLYIAQVWEIRRIAQSHLSRAPALSSPL